MEKYHYFLTEGGTVVLPVTPERASWEKGVNIEAINISAVGDVYRPGKPKRHRGQIEGFFPAHEYPWLAPGAVADPYYYVSLFSTLMEQKTVVRYIVGGTEINAQVVVEGLAYEERDGSGDVYYTLSLAEWVDLEAVTVSTIDTAWTGNAGTGNSGQTASQTTQQYTVVAGDMLSVICRRTYGNGSAKYYEALAAYNGIANPHLIHPGDVLQLPPEDQLFGR